jgi:hypothetical protein
MPYDKKKAGGHGRDHTLRHETEFRVAARRNKLVGLWAAELMGMSGEAADAYAKSVISADLEEAGDEDVIRKLQGDFEKHKMDVTRDQIVKQLAAMEEEARRQLQGS